MPKHCAECGRKGGCGCLWHSDTMCKKCHAATQNTTLPPDLKAEFDSLDKEVKTKTKTNELLP